MTSTFTLTGRILDKSKAPVVGAKLVLSSSIKTIRDPATNEVYSPTPRITTDDAGYLCVADGAGVPSETPGVALVVGSQYRLRAVNSGLLDAVAFTAPDAGTTLDLADVIPEPPVSGNPTWSDALGALVERMDTVEQAGTTTDTITAGLFANPTSNSSRAAAEQFAAPEGTMLATIGAPSTRRPVLATEPGHPFTVANAGSSNLNDTTSFAVGTQSVRFTTAGNGVGSTSTKLAATAVDLTGYDVGIWLRIDGLANLDQVNVYAGHASLAKSFVWTPARGTDLNPWALDGEWVFHTLNIGDANQLGSPSRTAITDWRIRAVDKNTGGTVTLRHGPIMLLPKHPDWPTGVVSITTDDGYDNNYTLMRPVLDKYGQSATLYIIRDLIGTAGKLTEAQVNDLRVKSGWEIGQHGDTIADHDATFPDLSTTALRRTVRDLRKWSQARGHIRGAEQVAYPQGRFNASVMDTLRPFVTTARTVTGTTRETLPPADPMRLRAVTGISSVGTTVAQTKALIDKAYAEGQWLILVFHRIVTGAPTSSIECSQADLDEICAYIATKGIPCRNVGDVAASVATPKPTPAAVSAPVLYAPALARKSADTTITNSAAVTADPHLTVPVVAGGVYKVESSVVYSASTAADLLLGWTYPAGSTMEWTPDGLSVGTTGVSGPMNRGRLAINGTTAVGGAGASTGSKCVAKPSGVFVAGADGNLTLAWAQGVAEATNAVMYADSALIVTRLA